MFDPHTPGDQLVVDLDELVVELNRAHNYTHEILGDSYGDAGRIDEDTTYEITSAQLHLLHDVTVLSFMAFQQQRANAMFASMIGQMLDTFVQRAEGSPDGDSTDELITRELSDDEPLH